MQRKGGEESDFRCCQDRSQAVQRVRVVIECLFTSVQLEIAAQMGDKKAAEREPCDRHEDFLPHGCRKDFHEWPQSRNLREQLSR